MAILIFDFDGTLHESIRIYEPAVRACVYEMRKAGKYKPEPSSEQIMEYLGLTTQQMWNAFAPELSLEEREENGQFIYREMRRLIREGQAQLFDGTFDMLVQLKAQGHTLAFLSNCSVAYMEENAKAFHLRDYFDEMYCAEQFDWLSKPQIVKILIPGWESSSGADSGLLNKNQITDPAACTIISIGDRIYDMEIANASEGIRTIFCAYGYGQPEEAENADEIVYSPSEIPASVSRLCSTDSNADHNTGSLPSVG